MTLKMTIHPLFTFTVFSNALDFIEVEYSIYQNVQYFIKSTDCVSNFIAVRHFCTNTRKPYWV